MPGEEYDVEFFIEEDDEDTGLELVTWHFVVIAAGAVVIIGLVFAILVSQGSIRQYWLIQIHTVGAYW